jgi:hypothetical protein
MDRAADAAGLRVADGIPTIFTGGRVANFPAKGDNVFTLENKAGHPVYKRRKPL